MNRPARFTQAELRRAIEAFRKAGIVVAVEISQNGVRFIPMAEAEKPKPKREITL